MRQLLHASLYARSLRSLDWHTLSSRAHVQRTCCKPVKYSQLPHPWRMVHDAEVVSLQPEVKLVRHVPDSVVDRRISLACCRRPRRSFPDKLWTDVRPPELKGQRAALDSALYGSESGLGHTDVQR